MEEATKKETVNRGKIKGHLQSEGACPYNLQNFYSMMALDSSGVQFQSSYSSYSLLPRRDKKGQSKMSSRGRKEGGDLSPLAMEPSSELSLVLAQIDTDVLSRIKIFLASEFTNGESFCPPLKQIKDVLER